MALDAEAGITFNDYADAEAFLQSDELKEVFTSFRAATDTQPIFLDMGRWGYDSFCEWMVRHIRFKLNNPELVTDEQLADAWFEFTSN